MDAAEITRLMQLGEITEKYSTYQELVNDNLYNTNLTIDTPFKKGVKPLFCDVTASSFPLRVVNKWLETNMYPFYTNTHSNNFFGRLMTSFVDTAKKNIVNCINGDCKTDCVLFTGSGCTGAVNHLVHLILPVLKESIVFVSDLEHLSNYLSWYHNAKKFVVVPTNEYGVIDPREFVNFVDSTLKEVADGSANIIVSVTHCSNVLGTLQPINTLSKLVHKRYSGLFFVDFAASAPYVPIDINKDTDAGVYLDACFISPHKFYGGQSSPGILVVKRDIICNDQTYTPGGSTCRVNTKSTGPVYNSNAEVSQQGGTPNIVGIVQASLAIALKTHYVSQIFKHYLDTSDYAYDLFKQIEKDHRGKFVLLNKHNPQHARRTLPIFSFQVTGYHYNYIVALLNDLFGITSRGGLSCSAVLIEKENVNLNLGIDINKTTESLLAGNGVAGDFGWVRVSFGCHIRGQDVLYVTKSISHIVKHANDYTKYYTYDKERNVFFSTECSDGICGLAKNRKSSPGPEGPEGTEDDATITTEGTEGTEDNTR